MEFNPLLSEPENPYADFNAKRLEVNKEAIELQRLCYEIFHIWPDGMKLYSILQNKYVIPAKFHPSDTNAPNLALYWEGFKEAIRGLYNQGLIHAKRINEGGTR